MGVSIKILKQAEVELENLRKVKEKENEARKKQFYKKFVRAEEIDRQLSKTAINVARAVFQGADTKKLLVELKTKNLKLQDELKSLLRAAKLPDDYLEIKYKCNKCKDVGYLDGIMCDCLRDLIKKITYDKLNKLSPLSLSTFETFDINYYPDRTSTDGVNIRMHMENVFDFCKKYADKFKLNSQNLFIQGATGLGKTHLSLAIANRVISCGHNVIYVSTPNIISRLEKEHFNYNFQEDETEKYLTECDLLILDDMGTEFQTSFSSSVVYNIINSRIMYKKPTIISTNLSIKEVQAAYSKRLVSRIMGNFKRLFFLGSDIRQLSYKKNKNNDTFL